MRNHPDRFFAKSISGILLSGAKIGYRGLAIQHRNPNHQSARSAPEILTADLHKQLQHDRLTQIDPQAEAQYVCSPLGLVPKHDDGWRRIHDLSFPQGQSVNNSIPYDWGSLKYAIYDDTVDTLLAIGPRAQFVKRDLKDAFRHILVTTSD